jgi:hypothetical protein
MGCFNSKPVCDELLKINKRLDDISSHINSIDESVYYIQKNMKKKHRSYRYVDNDISAAHNNISG